MVAMSWTVFRMILSLILVISFDITSRHNISNRPPDSLIQSVFVLLVLATRMFFVKWVKRLFEKTSRQVHLLKIYAGQILTSS